MGIVRSAFLIDEQGKLADVWYKISPEGHAEELCWPRWPGKPAGGGSQGGGGPRRLAGLPSSGGIITRVPLWPPKPNEFDSAGAGRPRAGFAGDDIDEDLRVLLGQAGGGRDQAPVRWSGPAPRPRASRPPPSECPVIPFIEVTAGPGKPNTLTMASDSGRSLAGVEVPWALMWVTASGVRPASSRASSMHATAPAP